MILFLDFDGVLHPEPCTKKELFQSLHLVEAILRDFPRVEIVVSSAWRLDYKYEHECVPQMRKHFSSDIAPRVIGVTPDHRYDDGDKAPAGLGAFQRHWECDAWLRAHRPPGTPWLALDDREWWFEPSCPNLMEFDCTIGFTEEHSDELRRRLRDMERAFTTGAAAS